MSASRRIGSGDWIGAALFFGSAALQYNDPDPIRWAAVYSGAGAACLLWRHWRPAWLLAATVGLAALAWGATYLPGVGRMSFGHLLESMKAETPQIEEARELLGLLIVAAWMAALAIRARRRSVA